MAKWQNKFSGTTETLVSLLLQIHAYPSQGSKKILNQYFLSPLRLLRKERATEEESSQLCRVRTQNNFQKNDIL
jgi:hypothetical protein